jgi:CDP-glycerol glycerophosphotransferase
MQFGSKGEHARAVVAYSTVPSRRIAIPGIVRKYAGPTKHWLVTLLLLLSPKRPHVVVFGYPESEGNAIEMVRALSRRYRGHIYLLAGNVGHAERVIEAAGLAGQPNLSIVSHHSSAGLWRFATAEVVMFTHGLFGYPRRVPRKVLVNLWHGSGIKAGTMIDHRGRPRFHANYLVSASRLKGRLQAKHSRLPSNGLLLTGNPRIDQFDGARTRY